jgi:hypothetical protein
MSADWRQGRFAESDRTVGLLFDEAKSKAWQSRITTASAKRSSLCWNRPFVERRFKNTIKPRLSQAALLLGEDRVADAKPVVGFSARC